MARSKSTRQIIAYFVLLCAGLLATIGISTEAIACIHDPAEKYAGMYFVYPNELGHMWILVETDTGVNDDDHHRKLYLSGSGCHVHHLEYHHYDYDYWRDGSGIPGKKDRRLWAIKATGLTPDCFYDAEFKYRDYYSKLGEWLSGCWHSTWGHFHSAPDTSSTNPDHIPEELEFYAYGDTRTINDRDDLKQVATAIMDHDGKHTFILHTGDIVYKGGVPVGWYYFRDGYKDKHHKDPEPWLLHKPDQWYGTFFKIEPVWEMLRHMPIFPAFGNHEFQDTAVNDKYAPQNDAANIKYSTPETRAYNYAHYFRGFNHGNDPKDQYYSFAYGPALVWSLTSFPMEDNRYCSDHNMNYRPKAEGGTGQYDWLKEELENSLNDPRQWKIVMMHAPMYSPCSCNNQKDAVKYLKPLFEDYGVDLVLTGHEHYYARKTENDIPYLILGGGGAGISLCKECITCPPPDYKCKVIPQCHGFDMVSDFYHFAHMKIDGDIMTVEVNSEYLEQIESFTVDRDPAADFEADYPEGQPLTVNFKDKSTGNVYKYDWDFGDGHTSQERNPSHTYADPGEYTVELIVSSAFNTSAPYSATVKTGPVADFDADPYDGDFPLKVQFTDNSNGSVSAYLWDFGDGTTSTERNPVHQYDMNGKFTVNLIVTGEERSDTKTKSDLIKVKPFADFSYEPSVCDLTSCHDYCTVWFTNYSKPDNLIYHWDFGDGATSTEQNPIHDFEANGSGWKTYKVELVVTETINTEVYTDSAIRYIGVSCVPWALHR